MKLYFSPGSCSLSPHIVLREAGLAFDLKRVNVATHELADGSDFLSINPRGYVPVLELDDGFRLTEGPAIVQHIVDMCPQSGLAPVAGTLERARFNEWLSFIQSELHHAGFAQLFQREANDHYKAEVRRRLAVRLDWVERVLASTPYLMGERFSAADAYLFVALGWSRYVNFDLAQWLALTAYQQRIGKRKATKEAIFAELQEVMLNVE
jgi:glutathione S-transferase